MQPRRHGNGTDADEGGFTFIEMVAALTVLAIGVVAVVGVMNSSFRVASVTASRSKGIAVASMEIERLRSIPYDHLRTLTTTQESVETVGGRSYTVKAAVTVEDEVTGDTRTTAAYHKAVVWVNWTDETGSHDVYQTTLIYPGGLGPFNAATTFTPSTSGGHPSPPTDLLAVSLTNVSGVDLSWTPPATSSPDVYSWVVQASKDPTFPSTGVQEVSANLPAAITMLRVENLAPSTTYHFRVFSKAENTKLSTTAATALDVTTAASTELLCSVGTATVTPSALHKKRGHEGSGLVSDPYVEVSTVGDCTGLTFRMQYSPRAGVVDDVLLAKVTTGTYAGSVKGTTQTWEVGEHLIDIFSYDSLNVKVHRATLRLIVCDSQKKVCP